MYETITLTPPTPHTTHTVTDVERDSAGCDKMAVDPPVAMTTATEPGRPLQTSWKKLCSSDHPTRQLSKCVCVGVGCVVDVWVCVVWVCVGG